jgi:hypothetical protein
MYTLTLSFSYRTWQYKVFTRAGQDQEPLLVNISNVNECKATRETRGESEKPVFVERTSAGLRLNIQLAMTHTPFG